MKIYREYKKAFAATFGKPLIDFWDSDLGFDVIKFDEEIANAEEGKSEP